MPGYWQAFQQSVLLRVFVQGDAGFGLLGQLTRRGGHLILLRGFHPSLEALLVIVPLLVLVVVLRKRRFGRGAERLWVPCLVVLAVLSNPRVLDYDANVAIVPAVYVAVEFFLSLPPGPYRGLQVGVPAILFLGLEASDAGAGLCLLLVVSVLMVICQLLWPGYFQRPGGEPDRTLAVGRPAMGNAGV